MRKRAQLVRTVLAYLDRFFVSLLFFNYFLEKFAISCCSDAICWKEFYVLRSWLWKSPLFLW